MSKIILPKPEPMTIETAQQIGGALSRLHELANQSVLTPTSDAERRGIMEFLQRVLPAHANELLACWLAIRHEYEPMVKIVAAVMRRAQAVNAKLEPAVEHAAERAAERAAEPATEEKK
jgi:hypothetical protein